MKYAYNSITNMANVTFHAPRQRVMPLHGGARKQRTEAAAWRRWGRTAMFLLLMPVCAIAQNNPYKIDDRLYKIYAEAAQKELTDESLTLADRMYREARAIGDGKAQCLARSVAMFHYYYTRCDDAAFERSVKAMQDDALRTGYRQYYYFGFTNRINYRLNTNRYREALTLAQEFVDNLRRANDNYGLFYSLNALGQVHLARNEIRIAIITLNEALEVGRKYAPDQDMATIYRKLVECHLSVYEYQKAYDVARLGYEVGKTKSIRLRLINRMAFAQMKLGNYEKAEELYRQYVTVRGGTDTTRNMTEEDSEMRIMHRITTGQYAEADSLIKGMDSLYNTMKLRLHIALFQKMGEWKKMAALRSQYYERRIANQDSMNLQDIVGISADLYDLKALTENRRLETERQRIANERQRTLIDNTNLELSNTHLLLDNSSLELGRARAEADRLRLANANKRLETERIKSRIAAAQARHDTFRLHATTAIAVVAVFIIAALMYVRIHRRITRNLRRIHNRLAINHIELKEARNKAVAASNVKTRLLQNMKRDVNIPLNAIAGFAQLIADNSAECTPEERAEYFRQISENTDRMLAIVKDVLEKAQK